MKANATKQTKVPVAHTLSATRRKLLEGFSPLWKHQKQTLDLALKSPILFDTSSPGTGKTRAHLEAFKQRLQQGSSAKCLILAPKSLLRTAWFNDAQKFTPDLRCSIAYSTNRIKAFEQEADIYITNTDAVTWLMKQPPAWLKAKFPPNSTLIFDEVTLFKHRTSGRSKAALKLSKLFQFRIGMTGTPNPHSVTELWHQILLLDGGQRLGKNFFHFRGAVQSPYERGQFTEWQDKPGIELAVAQILSDISVRHDFSTCMDIPPNFTYSRSFVPNQSLRDHYQEMMDTALLLLNEGTIKAVNAAVLQNKVLQILSGAAYDQEGKYVLLDTQRYELIADLIEETQHSVCFFNWSHQKEQIARILTQRNIPHAILDGTVPIRTRERIVFQYQRGELQTILLHPQTGAHGLTLTKGTRTIWSSPIFQADFLVQGKHRIYRGGQTMKTETILVEAENTIEGRIYERLNNNEQKMANFLDLIKEA